MFGATDPVPEDLPTQAAQSLMQVVPALHRLYRSLLTARFPHQTGLPQFRILLRLRAVPDVSLKDLADREGVTPPTMSRSGNTLVDRGWVSRTGSKGDRRSVHLALTPEGTRLANQVLLDLRTQFADLLKAWKPDDLGLLIDALTVLDASGIFESDSAKNLSPAKEDDHG